MYVVIIRTFSLPCGALNGTNGACLCGGVVDVGVVALCERDINFCIFVLGLSIYCFNMDRHAIGF